MGRADFRFWGLVLWDLDLSRVDSVDPSSGGPSDPAAPAGARPGT